MNATPKHPTPSPEPYRDLRDRQAHTDEQLAQIRRELDELKMMVVGYDGQTKDSIRDHVATLQREAAASEVRQDVSDQRQNASDHRQDASEIRHDASEVRHSSSEVKQIVLTTQQAMEDLRQTKAEDISSKRWGIKMSFITGLGITVLGAILGVVLRGLFGP